MSATLLSDWNRLRAQAIRFAQLWCSRSCDAEDVAQDALIALLQHPDDLQDPDAFLFTSVKRIALRKMRFQRRQHSLASIKIALAAPASETAFARRALWGAAGLSQRDKVVLAMTLDGYTQSEIASKLRVTRSVVAQYVARARRKLVHPPRKKT